MQESWEGLRGGKLSKVNNGGRERKNLLGKSLLLWGRRGPFIGPHKIDPLATENLDQKFPNVNRNLWFGQAEDLEFTKATEFSDSIEPDFPVQLLHSNGHIFRGIITPPSYQKNKAFPSPFFSISTTIIDLGKLAPSQSLP